jgi:hypothetical protein
MTRRRSEILAPWTPPVAVIAYLLLVIAWAWPVPAAAQQTKPASTIREVGRDQELRDLLLVRTTSRRAVVRFGDGALEVVSVGDRLGRNRAEVVEIETKRLVLDERFTGRDGAPNRAQIVLSDGERGGTRYLEHSDDPPATSRRPVNRSARPKD